MLLGARQFFERRGAHAWTNPYVTDGLIAMWDAEWNAGGGVHDANYRLVELCGNGPQMTLDHNCVIGANSISFTTQSGYSSLDDTEHFGGITDAFGGLPDAPSVVTNECVFASDNSTSWSDFRIGFTCRNGTGLVRNARRCLVYSYARGTTRDLTCYYNTASGLGLASYSSSGNPTKAYLNGAELVSYDGGGNVYSSDSRVRILGASVQNAQLVFSCLRLYNRVLADEERIANYAVDKARFNLP